MEVMEKPINSEGTESSREDKSDNMAKKIKAEDWREGPPGLAWAILDACEWDEEKLIHTRFRAEDRERILSLKKEASECRKMWEEIDDIKKQVEALGDDYKGEVQERTIKTLGLILGRIRAHELDVLMFFYPQATEYIINVFEKMKEGELIYSIMEEREGDKWYYSELHPILSRYGGGFYEKPPEIGTNFLQWPNGHVVNTPLTKDDEALLDQYIKERMAIREDVIEEVAKRIKAKKKAKGETIYGINIFQLDNIFKSLYSPKDRSSPKKIIPLNNQTGQNAIVTFLATPGEDILKKNGFTPYERWVERGVLSFVASDTKGWSLSMLWRAMVRDPKARLLPTEEKKLKEALERLDTKKLLVDVEQDIQGKYAMLGSIDWEKEKMEAPRETNKGGKTVLSMKVRELDLVTTKENRGGHETEVYYLSRPPFTFLCFSKPTGQYITTPDEWFHPSIEKMERTSSEEGLLRDIAIEHVLNAIDMTKNRGWPTKIRYASILEECGVYPAPKEIEAVELQPKDLEKLPQDHTEEDILDLKKKRRDTDRKLYNKWKKRLVDFLKAWGEDRYNEGLFTEKPKIGDDSIELFIDLEEAFKMSPSTDEEGKEDKEENTER